MRFSQGFAATIGLLIAMSTAGQAQVNEQTAEEIRLGIKVWIGQNVQGGSGMERIELDDRITVVPDGGLYRVTLPGGRAIMAGEGTLHFGAVAIDLTPIDGGHYDASWRLPDRYRIEPTYGSEVLLTISNPSGRGVFAPEFQTMLSMDMDFGDIAAAEIDGDAHLAFWGIAVVTRSTEVSPGVYDLQSTLSFDSLQFVGNDDRNRFEVDDAEFVVMTDDGRLAELAEFQRQANTLTMEMEGANDLDQINAQVATLADLIDSVPTLLAGVRMEARTGAVTVKEYGDQFTMDAGTFSLALDGLDQDRSTFELATGSDGMGVSDPEIAKIIPTESRFRLAMTDLPNSELIQLGVGTMRSMGTTDPEMAMLMAAGSLQQTLTIADSTLQIGPIRLASDIASIDLEGGLRPEAKSPYGTVGEIDMVATGLDALIVEIQNSGGDRDAVQFLTLLQSMGAQAPDADGRSVRTYAFRLDASGTLLLNGSDIMPLLSGMQ